MQTFVMGASGLSGQELLALLGDRVTAATGAGFLPHDAILSLASVGDVVLLATPAEASLHWVPKLLAMGVRVIDLSGAFRLKDADAYPTAYGFTHSAPELLAESVYGLTQVPTSPTRLVANPGCYATAAAIGALPLGGLIGKEIVVDAASGTSGAGKGAFTFDEVFGDSRAYKVLAHQHTPEIVQTLANAWGWAPWLTLTTKLLPLERGILATVYARLANPMSSEQLTQHYRNYYADHPLVSVVDSPNHVRLKQVVHTNKTLVGVASTQAAHDPGRVVVTVAIDNLRKGAAWQAIENLDRMLQGDEQ